MKVWTVERSENVVISCILYIDHQTAIQLFGAKLTGSLGMRLMMHGVDVWTMYR